MRFILALALLALAACSRPGEPGASSPTSTAQAASPAVTPQTIELGRKIYNFRCYFCHGYSGDAQTLAATYLDPKPRDFTKTTPGQLSRDSMLLTIRNGHPGTAMKSFADILTPAEIDAVADFVRREFMEKRAPNTRYHTAENGWADHDRYAAAFPFATGKVTLDTPVDQLTSEQRAGRRLFMTSCVSCHDRAKVASEGNSWDSRPLSYPRNGFSPADAEARAKGEGPVDGIASATPYHLHDKAPQLSGLTSQERRGETLFQQNCAFCHAADGTARNWIGSFLEPHPRDLTSAAFMNTATRERLANAIRDGLPGTSMPAWKSVLTDADIDSIVAYISRAFHPVGSAASATQAQGLPSPAPK
jgi:cytochrome c oxidase cbb3-type subunit III